MDAMGALDNVLVPCYEAVLLTERPLNEVKDLCRKLEIDEEGNRISDIDIFYKDIKISRKHPTQLPLF